MDAHSSWEQDIEREREAERQRAQQVAVAAAAWRKAWPNHCAACRGWGGSPFTEMHGFKFGPGEQLFDPCQALPNPATCHRCGQDGLDEDGEGPCKHCGWNCDDGVPE